MPINFGLANYVDPNAQIKATEIPVPEIQQSIEKLDKYYDAARQYENKTDALMRRMYASAHDVDKPVVEQMGKFYADRLKQRASSGNYEDMIWQTQADAEDMATNYEKVAKDAELISKYESEILSDKNITDPMERKANMERWRKEVATLGFNPELRALSGRSVNTPNFAADVHIPTMLDKMLSGYEYEENGIKTKTFNISDGTMIDSDGTTIPAGRVVVITKDGVVREASEQEMAEGSNQVLQSDPAVMSMFQRKTENSIHRKPLEEGETFESRMNTIYEREASPSINFFSKKHGYKREATTTGVEMKKDGAGGGSRGGSGAASGTRLYPERGQEQFNIEQQRQSDFMDAMDIVSGELSTGDIRKNLDAGKILSGIASPFLAVFSGKATEKEGNEMARTIVLDKLSTFVNSDNPNANAIRSIPGFFPLITALQEGRELTSIEKEALVEAKKRLTDQSGNSSNKMNVSGAYSTETSPEGVRYLERHFKEEFNAKGTEFNAHSAKSLHEKNLFGENKDAAEGTGQFRNHKLMDLNTGKEIQSGDVLVQSSLEGKEPTDGVTGPKPTEGPRRKKELPASWLGIYNHRGLGMLYPKHTNAKGEIVQGNLGYIGSDVVTVGGKQYLAYSPGQLETDLNDPDMFGEVLNSRAEVTADYLLHGQSTNNVYFEDGRGVEMPLQTKTFGSKNRVKVSIPGTNIFKGVNLDKNMYVYKQLPDGRRVLLTKTPVSQEEIAQKPYLSDKIEGIRYMPINPLQEAIVDLYKEYTKN